MFEAHRTDRDQRSFRAKVFGNTPEELEMAALDAAREFFGPEPHLEVAQTYQAFKPLSRDSQNTAAMLGKTYMADVVVRLAE
jgi:hypothetical protein